MRQDWVFRWWDAVALGVVLAAAVLVVQAGLGRPGGGGTRHAVETLTVLVPRPLPEIAREIVPGAALRDAQGREAGRVRDVEWVEARPAAAEGLAGDRDLRVTLRVDGELTLARDLRGFHPSPGDLRIGHWLLLRVESTELSGLIIGITPGTREGP